MTMTLIEHRKKKDLPRNEKRTQKIEMWIDSCVVRILIGLYDHTGDDQNVWPHLTTHDYSWFEEKDFLQKRRKTIRLIRNVCSIKTWRPISSPESTVHTFLLLLIIFMINYLQQKHPSSENYFKIPVSYILCTIFSSLRDESETGERESITWVFYTVFWVVIVWILWWTHQVSSLSLQGFVGNL